MGVSGGPKTPTTNLLATYQPGDPGYLQTNTTVNYASDVATPSFGTATGPRRTINNGFGPAYEDPTPYYTYGPVMEIKNIPGSIYTINTATSTVYTISLWVKIVSTPAVYNSTRSFDTGGTLSTKSKRLALARFNYSSSNLNRRGWIEFGAMAPYYLNNSNVKNYKSIFAPISFGAAIVGIKRTYSVYTDYKFNLNQWYLVTLQIESSSNFGVLTNQTVTTKMFVNNTQENIAQFQGIAWRQNHRRNSANNDLLLVRRKRGAVAAQPGFLNRATGGTVSNASSQSFMFKYFPDLGNLNYISYSPLKKLDGPGGNADNMNNGSTSPMLFGSNASSTYQKGSGINFGQTYIYNTAFDSNIYTQFKPLYR